MMDVETLYSLVSDAIWRAEQAEDGTLPAAAALWAEVSSLEERLAQAIPTSEGEGRIARRGAVRAALKAADPGRAQMLVDRFAAESECPPELVAELHAMMSTDEQIRRLLDGVSAEGWAAAGMHGGVNVSQFLSEYVAEERQAHDPSHDAEFAIVDLSESNPDDLPAELEAAEITWEEASRMISPELERRSLATLGELARMRRMVLLPPRPGSDKITFAVTEDQFRRLFMGAVASEELRAAGIKSVDIVGIGRSETSAASPSPTPSTMRHVSSHVQQLGTRIVREREAHDLSRNPEFASFQFIGYRTSAAAVEIVALCDADGLLEGDIVRLRDEFFELVRRLPHEYGLKPRGRNPNGLLGFVFADGCPEHMARFIARQTRISHAAGTGGVSVAWAIDVRNRRIHTHDNPVSIFPPVIIAARMVYPGLEFLQTLLDDVPVEVTAEPPGSRISREEARRAEPHAYDLFISYASEDRGVAIEIARALESRGLRVWIDATALKPGDSLREAVERGVAGSRFGLVLLSRNFFRKEWTQRELNGLFTREMTEGRTLVLPLWHQIDAREIATYSPILADKYALKTSDGIPFIADRLVEMFNPSPTPPIISPQPADPPRSGWPGAGGKIHILFLAANSVHRPLDVDWEVKRIEADLRAAKERDRLEFKLVVAATIDSMMQAMLDDSPTIVHFSGHGRTEGILLRNEAGSPHLVSGKALASLFKLFRETVKCVVLNACWSEPQARAIREHIPHVIGTRAEIADDTAVAFSTGFYKAIGAGRDVPFAYEMGLARVQAESDDAGDLVTLL